MLHKAHLTSHPRMSRFRWTTTPSWLSNHKEYFCIVLCILVTSSNLFCFCEVLTVSVLYHVHPCMKYFLDMSNYLEESSSPSHSIIFFYFFALFILEGLLFSSCYPLELCIQLGISFPFLLCLLFLFFPQLSVMPPQTTTLPSCISFPWRWFWSLHPVWCYKLPSTVLWVLRLSDLIPWIYLSFPLYTHKGFDLDHIWMA